MKKLLRKIKRLADKFFGSWIDEWYWKFRHIFDKKWAESYISRGSINHPHRKFFIEKISAYFPFDNALEIGCASGPNLYLLAKKCPRAKFYGIDISKKAIGVGKKFFEKEKIDNVFLSASVAEKLKDFKDKSVDIVFTDATLIYIGPDKIKLVIKEIIRVAKKSVVLCELHGNITDSSYNDHWIHNYRAMFGGLIPEEKIKTTKISPEVWGENWGKLGYIIEVVL